MDGTCPKCNEVHLTRFGTPACTGHKKRPFAACTNAPCDGLTVCRYHGGNSAQARAVREKAKAERQAAAGVRRFGGPVDISPTEALLDTVRWTAGYVAWLREKVAAARNDRELVWGQTRAKIGGEDRGTTYASGPNVWLQLLGEWQDRLVGVCAAAIKAGIEERRVQLAEGQGALVADAIRDILNDLGLSAEQTALVSEVVPRRLRLLAGGAA